MTDQHPGDPSAGGPAGGPDPTRVDGAAAHPDPTRIDGTPGSDGPAAAAGPGRGQAEAADEESATGEVPVTEDVPERWSGSAAVPPPTPKKSRWGRRNPVAEPPPPPVDPWADSEDWSTTPAVDPWADQDTPVDVLEPFPEAMPPTRIDQPLPPTRAEQPLPPTRVEAPAGGQPLPPTRIDAPAGSQPSAPAPAAPAPQPPAAVNPPGATPGIAHAKPPAPTPAAEPRRRGWGRKRREETPVNRLPVQPRQAALPQAYVDRARPLPPPPPGKAAKKRRKGPTPPPPPAWRPPQAGPPPGSRPLPPPPRRKRRWGRRLLLFTLLGALCCCGVPGYFLWPAARQYPVSAVLPSSVADLRLRDDDAGRRATERLADQVQGTSLISSGEAFAGMYADGNGKRVTLFGTTGFRLTPQSDVEAELAHLSGEYKIEDIRTFDLGVTGAHERCGVGRSGGAAVVVCAWADHGSLATVLFTRRSMDESAELTGVLREAVLRPQIEGNVQLSSG
ncbi:hypothetical protein AB0J80_37305 [Actinoplanes sp. NPDC049548]|uniref:hypothetical protein n=1 Tax=Actinoplanes sp. NPDC049548 TaxID=3155152 RepID=UPI00344AA966